jgi:hypothetical protein
MSEQPTPPTGTAHFCAVCVEIFQPGMPPVRGTNYGGAPVETVTMAMVRSGYVVKVWNSNTTLIPMFAVTVVGGTLVCEIHAPTLLAPLINNGRRFLAPWQMMP